MRISARRYLTRARIFFFPATLGTLLLPLLAACGDDYVRKPLEGDYRLVNSTEATLTLSANQHYELCIPDHTCESGTYEFEKARGTYRWDRIGFAGRALEAEGLSVGNIEYDGPDCPCILYMPEVWGPHFARVAD
jgi:hypothetical protein